MLNLHRAKLHCSNNVINIYSLTASLTCSNKISKKLKHILLFFPSFSYTRPRKKISNMASARSAHGVCTVSWKPSIFQNKNRKYQHGELWKIMYASWLVWNNSWKYSYLFLSCLCLFILYYKSWTWPDELTIIIIDRHCFFVSDQIITIHRVLIYNYRNYVLICHDWKLFFSPHILTGKKFTFLITVH